MFQVPVGDCFILIQDDCDLSSVGESSTTGETPKIVFIQIDDIPNEPMLSSRTSVEAECRERLNITIDHLPMESRDDSSSVPDTPTLLSLSESMASERSVAESFALLPMDGERDINLSTNVCNTISLMPVDAETGESSATRVNMPLLTAEEDQSRGSAMESSDQSVEVDGD